MPPKKDGGASSAVSSSAQTQSVAGVRKLLERNHIHIMSIPAAKRGAKVIEKAKAIVKGFRKSEMEIEIAHELVEMIIEDKTDDELTFLINVMKVLLNDTRLVKLDQKMDGTHDDVEAWIETSWKKDKLKCTWNCDFVKNSVPPLKFFDEPQLESLAEDVPKVKNPKPDITFGLRKEAFLPAEQLVNDTYGSQLTTNNYHPFCVIEAKSCAEPIESAENQCGRAGSAMNAFESNFKAIAKKAGDNKDKEEEEDEQSSEEDAPSATGPDHSVPHEAPSGETSKPGETKYFAANPDAMAFSIAICPSKAHLFVHWPENEYHGDGRSASLYWHMSLIDSFDLVVPQHWIALHHHLDNILDWGVGKRKRDIQKSCQKLLQSRTPNKKRKVGEDGA